MITPRTPYVFSQWGPVINWLKKKKKTSNTVTAPSMINFRIYDPDVFAAIARTTRRVPLLILIVATHTPIVMLLNYIVPRWALVFGDGGGCVFAEKLVLTPTRRGTSWGNARARSLRHRRRRFRERMSRTRRTKSLLKGHRRL